MVSQVRIPFLPEHLLRTRKPLAFSRRVNGLHVATWSPSGTYAARHNPAVYFQNLGSACLRNDVPLTLPLNLSARFTFITPNICNDMHSCPVATGDSWLRRMVPQILKSSQYQSHSTALFITFDENDSQASNQVPTLVIAPSVPRGERVGAHFTHYSFASNDRIVVEPSAARCRKNGTFHGGAVPPVGPMAERVL